MIAVIAPVIAGLTVLAGLFRAVWPKYRAYRRRADYLDDLEATYESLRSARKDVVYHYYWATDRGDFKEADTHINHCEEIDIKLDEIRATFREVENGAEITHTPSDISERPLKTKIDID